MSTRISCACHHVMHSAITWLCELCIDVLGSGLAPRGCSDRWRCHPGPESCAGGRLLRGDRWTSGVRGRSARAGRLLGLFPLSAPDHANRNRVACALWVVDSTGRRGVFVHTSWCGDSLINSLNHRASVKRRLLGTSAGSSAKIARSSARAPFALLAARGQASAFFIVGWTCVSVAP
jgi:hypothetical protein